jgi:hypothetical protein
VGRSEAIQVLAQESWIATLTSFARNDETYRDTRTFIFELKFPQERRDFSMRFVLFFKKNNGAVQKYCPAIFFKK